MIRLTLCLLTLPLILVACTASPDSSTPTAEPTADETAPVATEDPPPEKTSAPVTTTTATSTGSSNDDAREMTASECRTLAEKFEQVTRADQWAKVPENTSEAQREKARKSIDEGARRHAENWENGCKKDLIGKMASEKALKCAMAAKTVSAFDTCVQGTSQ